MPPLSQLLNAHFQGMEMHRKVWLICKYRLAPLPWMQSCPLGSRWYSRFMKYLAQAGRTENELAGAEDGADLILALLMKPTVADTDYAQVDYTWGQCLHKTLNPCDFPIAPHSQKALEQPDPATKWCVLTAAGSFPYRLKQNIIRKANMPWDVYNVDTSYHTLEVKQQ